jgi:hypothetical protein
MAQPQTSDQEKKLGHQQLDRDKSGDENFGFGSIRQESQEFDIKGMQSALDPDKGTQLLEYNLDAFKNSIWENFLGSHVQMSKLVEKDGSSKVTNQIVSKLGPI